MSNNPPLTQRPLQEHTFLAHDGAALFYRHWPAVSGARRGAIVLFHRGHEHSARMAHVVDELNLPDFDFFAGRAHKKPKSRGQVLQNHIPPSKLNPCHAP
jgi:alpha-beta hydrolase superfamily lysophospholipase